MIEFMVLMSLSLIFIFVSVYFKVNHKIMAFIYIIIVCFFAANRDINIPDTYGYITFFTNLNLNFGEAINTTYMEPGFVFLSIIIKYIAVNNYKAYFFIISLLNMVLIMIGIYFFYTNETKSKPKNMNLLSKNEKIKIKYAIPLCIYFITYGYSFNFITLRAGIAYSFIFLAFSLFDINKPVSLVFYLISISLHNSALLVLMVIPFFIYKKNYSRMTYTYWLMLIPVLSYIGYKNMAINLYFNIVNRVPFLASRFHAYLGEDIIISHNSSFIRIIILIIIGILIVSMDDGKIKYNVGLKTYFLGISIFTLFINIAIVGRISELLITGVFALISYNVNFYKSNSIYKITLMSCLAYFIISNYRLIM